jgi:cyclopropane-fatty-acyl-phospholipid synthase
LSTEALRDALGDALPQRPFRVALWDGSELPATTDGDVPVFTVHSPVALGHMLRARGQLGLGRAYVSGNLSVDDIDKTLQLLADYKPAPVDARAKARLAAAAVRAGALKQVPHAPLVELRPQGRRHSVARDRRAVTHHYDVSNDFFALFLGPSMTYSCAYWRGGAETLEEAQVAKHELVCTKLALGEGDRVLDVGCGWGAFAVHAARHHGARVTGITLSAPQAERARRHAEEEGVADRVEIRVADYRDLGGETYDAIASVGMVEHVGAVNIDAYARTLAGLLQPGGRLLNHGIARLRHGEPEAGPFSERFVFPDAAPLHLSRVQHALEAAGFETLHVEGLREDYARTLREWTRRLEEHHAEGVRLAGDERMRVWQVYLRAARRGFETGFTSIYQVRAIRP